MLLFFFIFKIFTFWPYRAACGILVPRTRIEPVSPALEVWHLNHWTTREVPICLLMSHGQLSTSQGKVNVLFSLLFHLRPTLWHPMEYSLIGFSIHGIFPSKSTGVGCHFLHQGIFPTQGSNLGLPHCRQMLYPLSHQESSGTHKIVSKSPEARREE